MVQNRDQWQALLNTVLPLSSVSDEVFFTKRSLAPQEGIRSMKLVSLRFRIEIQTKNKNVLCEKFAS
jgi:RNase P subunit RPR2